MTTANTGNKAAVKTEQTGTAIVQPIDVRTVGFTIKQRGNSPLVMHAWGEKALNMLRMTAAERKKQPKVGRDPETEANAATHFMEDGRVGLPAMAVKNSILNAAHKDTGIPRTTVMKALFIKCADRSLNIPLEYEVHTIREDIVRVGMAQTDIRYRPEFQGWRAYVEFEIDARVLNTQDLITLATNAGFGVGLLEFRPEKKGEWGRFEIDLASPIRDEVLAR